MPISLSAKKSNRKSLKNRKVNIIWKNKYKEVIKKFLLKPSKEGLQEVYSIIDKLAKKFIIHKNKASRLKAKFARKLKSLVKGDKVAPAVKKVVKKAKKKITSKSTKKKGKSVK
jgi:small subunit ribosomal protein S20